MDNGAYNRHVRPVNIISLKVHVETCPERDMKAQCCHIVLTLDISAAKLQSPVKRSLPVITKGNGY